MKARQLIFLILGIILVDQVLKFYIKLNFYAGEEHAILGSWFRLHFVENEGMAWGWKFGGGFGKIALTLFRLVAVIWGTFLLRDFIRKQYHKGFIICAGLIYAGALGNLIDSLFYGLIFEQSNPFTQNVARFFPPGGGYASFLHGKVVDMLYFPIITDTHYPAWVPFVGGDEFEFFRPVFNLADASISTGVIVILIFQNKFFKQKQEPKNTTMETGSVVDDKTQIF
ncbi:MAG: lipoprotein signal peptidase [Chitinophagaceae bacterium]|nr:lipoprotein signal peptidase [Chitinophagaceae bacterium]